MKAYHICYHTDEDGLAAAAVIYEYLKKVNKTGKKKIRYFFYKIDYTVDLRTVISSGIPSGDEIYFVDYSFNDNNLDYVLELCDKGIKIMWIDHHKSSLDLINNDKYKNVIYDKYPQFKYFVDTNYCGAYLAYIYAYFRLHTNYPISFIHNFNILVDNPHIPLYIKYVDSWDSWKHDMPYTTEFNLGVRTDNRTPRSTFGSMFKYNSSIIDKLFSNDKNDIEMIELYMKVYINDKIYKGKTIKAYQDIINESLCNEYGFEFNIVDNTCDEKKIYSCFALNKRGNSTMFGSRINDYDIVVPFQFNGNQYVYSLYTSKEDIDCCELAKKIGSMDGLGGGGHQKAAGFQTLNQIIDSNCTLYINNKLFRKNKYVIFTVLDRH